MTPADWSSLMKNHLLSSSWREVLLLKYDTWTTTGQLSAPYWRKYFEFWNFLVLRAFITTLCSRSLREAFLTKSSLPMQSLETACVAQCGVGFSAWNLKKEMHWRKGESQETGFLSCKERKQNSQSRRGPKRGILENDYYPRGLYDSTELREVVIPYPVLGKALSVHDLFTHSVLHSGYCAPLFEGLGIRQQVSYQFFLLTQKSAWPGWSMASL